MNRGKLVESWPEPDTWRQTVMAHGKQEGVSTFPWLSWISILGLVSGLITWKWSDADPTTRASVPKLIGFIIAFFGIIVGMVWMQVRLSIAKKTTIYERGLVHGSLIEKRWIPWSEMEYFYVDEGSVGARTFRFLYWSQRGAGDEEFSVVPDNVDLDAVVRCLANNNVEQAGA